MGEKILLLNVELFIGRKTSLRNNLGHIWRRQLVDDPALRSYGAVVPRCL